MTSRSSRPIRAPGNSAASSSSTRCVPAPTAMRSPPHVLQTHSSLCSRAAVMTAQRARARVHREPSVAARALQRVLALGAEERGREAAPVQEQQHLVAGREVLADRGDERRRQRLAARVLLEVDDPHARHARRADPPRHLELAIAALLRVREALERRRRGREHHGHAEPARAHDREIARRVTKAALLLVRSVVLLVDDHEPGRGQRREHRRTRADDELAPRCATLCATLRSARAP